MGRVHVDDTPADHSAVLVGGVLSERYRVERHIRSSNMSHVYEAHDLTLQQRVAIKVLNEEILNERTLCRFFLEARIGRLLGENSYTVTVTDVGFTAQAVPYLVMEYLAGEDLAAYLRKHRRITPERAIVILLELCNAVAALHAAGVVHRDLKPSNVFLRDNGQVCLIDFGVCKLTDSDISLTHTGELVGSLQYVPPERWIDPDDARLCGDVWGLAIILYELLSGKLPFKGQSRDSLKQAILTHELALDFDTEARLPELHTVLLVALHKDPRYRYSTVPEFAAALGRAAFDAGLLEEPGVFDRSHANNQLDGPRVLEDSANVIEAPSPRVARNTRPATRRRALTWGIAALAVSGAIVAGLTELRGAAEPTTPIANPSSPIVVSDPAPTVEQPAHASSVTPLPPAPTRSIPSATATRAVRAASAPASGTAASSQSPHVADPLPRPADPPFVDRASSRPSASATTHTLDVTPADLRHF